jgi:hypothetical protein
MPFTYRLVSNWFGRDVNIGLGGIASIAGLFIRYIQRQSTVLECGQVRLKLGITTVPSDYLQPADTTSDTISVVYASILEVKPTRLSLEEWKITLAP